MTNDDNLQALATFWLAAKGEELAANQRRLDIEDQIVQAINPNKDGKSTFKLDGGLKICITLKTNFKADDMAALEALTAEWPENFQPVRIKKELNETKLKDLREYRADLWKKLAQHITSKAAKPYVQIESGEDK